MSIILAISGASLGSRKIRQIDKPMVKIGRLPGNDVVLKDPSVSSNHALIVRKGEAYTVSDLKSTNGTYLDNQPLPPAREHPLVHGQTLVVGCFRIELLAEAPAKSPGPDTTKPANRTGGAVGAPPFSRTIAASNGQASIYRDPEVCQLKSDIQQRLLAKIDLRRLNLKQVNDDELRRRCQLVVSAIVDEKKSSFPAKINRQEFIKDILDEALGLGPLEDLLADPQVSDIMVNRRDQIYLEKNGRLEMSPKIFSSDASILGVIQRIVGPLGRRIDESSPMVDARLPDGSRVNAIIPPLALNGPCLTIRKFSKTPMSVETLLAKNTLSQGMMKFLQTAVNHRQNIMISGGTGSGKTTLLNLLSSFIPEGERLLTIEDAAELQLHQEHVVRLESRPRNLEGKGEISIRDLVKNGLRMRPDRIIVGECRGGEALDMLQAMNTGHDGSLTTGHANTPKDMLSRLETMVMMAGQDLPARAIREQIVAALDLVVQQTRFGCGSRKITEISEVCGIDDGDIILQPIFYFRQDGIDQEGKVQGTFIATGWVPDIILKLQKHGLDLDLDIFQNW